MTGVTPDPLVDRSSVGIGEDLGAVGIDQSNRPVLAPFIDSGHETECASISFAWAKENHEATDNRANSAEEVARRNDPFHFDDLEYALRHTRRKHRVAQADT